MAKSVSGKVKAPAQVINVPQSREAAAQAIHEIGLAQRERTRIEAVMNDEMAGVKARYEGLALPWNEKIQALRDGVQIFCEANRESLTQGGKVKFSTFTTGEVKWRFTPPSVSVKAAIMTMEVLARKGFARFLRTKTEVNKEAILAETDAAKLLMEAGIAGVTITQKEEFVIEPFETKLEEVA